MEFEKEFNIAIPTIRPRRSRPWVRLWTTWRRTPSDPGPAGLNRMQLRRVVVTGLGALTPLGNTLSGVLGGFGQRPQRCCAHHPFRPVQVQDPRFACEVKGFNPEDFIDRKEARKMDPYTQFAVVAPMRPSRTAGWTWRPWTVSASA
jgi:hypothetical protein